MLDFYCLPDDQPDAEDPTGLERAGSLTFEELRAMSRVADGRGNSLPTDFHDDQRLTLAEVEELSALVNGLRDSGQVREVGNSAFESLNRILACARERQTGLQSFAD